MTYGVMPLGGNNAQQQLCQHHRWYAYKAHVCATPISKTLVVKDYQSVFILSIRKITAATGISHVCSQEAVESLTVVEQLSYLCARPALYAACAQLQV